MNLGTYLRITLLVMIIFTGGISCGSKQKDDKAAIKINDYSMTADEFTELFLEQLPAKDTIQARKLFLENIIIRKLVLQEAQKQGLDKQKDFLKAIENFWEQSLLTIVIDKKTREFAKDLYVTEAELKRYYDKWQQDNPDTPKEFSQVEGSIEALLRRKKQKIRLNSWVEELRKQANIKIDDKKIGIK